MDVYYVSIRKSKTTAKLSENSQKSVIIILFNGVISVCFVCLVVFNATFNNISVLSWQSVLLVKETGGPQRKPPTCRKNVL